MLRLALYTAGISAGLLGWVVWGNRSGRTGRVPVKQAADMLREAWPTIIPKPDRGHDSASKLTRASANKKRMG